MQMAKQVINGSDNLPISRPKINDNFDELYAGKAVADLVATQQERPNIVHHIVVPSPDQISPAPSVLGNATISLSDEQVFSHLKSIKIVCNTAATHQIRWLSGSKPAFDVDGTTAIHTHVPFKKWSEICMRVYITDPSHITSFGLYIMTDSGLSVEWIRTTSSHAFQPVKAGWNTFRFGIKEGTSSAWDTGGVHRLRFLVICSSPTTVYVDHIWAVERPKASIMFVSDHGHKWFGEGTDSDGTPTGGYSDLKARGLPMTFACIPGFWPDGGSRPTAEQMRELCNENGNAGSFHSFISEGGSATELTVDEIVSYSNKAIRALKEAGIHWFPFRAAWLQNVSATFIANNTILDDLFWGIATASSTPGIMTDPPNPLWNVKRTAIHGKTEADIDDLFLDLDRFKPLVLHFTHWVGAGDFNTAPERWEQYLALVDARIADGSLEFITPETLFRRNGGLFVNTGGQQYWSYTDQIDNVERKIRA